MSIPQLQKACKQAINRFPIEVLVLIVTVLFSLTSFLLGQAAGRNQGGGEAASIVPVELIFAPPEESPPTIDSDVAIPTYIVGESAGVSGAFVASRNGTKYYAPWCGTVARIKEENKVWFQTEQEAVAAGFGKAANCKF